MYAKKPYFGTIRVDNFEKFDPLQIPIFAFLN